MQKVRVCLLTGLVLLTLSQSGCGVLGGEEGATVDLTEILPDELPSTGQARRLDIISGNDSSEWLVFYHIDLVEDNLKGSPTAAAVYRPVNDPDTRLPPHLVPVLLWLPSQGYVCLHKCEAEMRDVISNEPKDEKELVIRDKRDGDTVGLVIFRWQKDLVTANSLEPGGFVSLGHFRADSIEVEKDKMTLTREFGYRSDLATHEVYVPRDGSYYCEQAAGGDGTEDRLCPPHASEVVFAQGPPKDPAGVKLPEKLVMAFYQNFTAPEEIKGYVTDALAETVSQGCPAGRCGCASEWKAVSRVQVKQIAYETEDKPEVSVVIQVRCIRRDGQADPLGTVTWRVRKQEDGTWRLSEVFPGGDVCLWNPLSCSGP
jgi:hypothetical protein